MSLTRFISAMAGLALFFFIIFLPPVVFGTVIFLIALRAIYEFNLSMKKAEHAPFHILTYISALLVLLTLYFFESDASKAVFFKIAAGGYFSLVILVLSGYLLTNKKHQMPDVFVSVFSFVYLAPLFSTLVAVRYLDYGMHHIFIAFGGAWMTDTFAYFSGRLFGKKKLIPDISPNKTKAGAVGGVAGTTVITIIYGIYLNMNVYSQTIPLAAFVFLGLLLSIFSQFGDLAASAIKRYTKIKDFGNLMPGHGGAIDRFDSVLFTSAITLMFIMIFF